MGDGTQPVDLDAAIAELLAHDDHLGQVRGDCGLCVHDYVGPAYQRARRDHPSVWTGHTAGPDRSLPSAPAPLSHD